MAHYDVKNDFKMLTYYLYAPLFQSFLPCTALIDYLFQQALKMCLHQFYRFCIRTWGANTGKYRWFEVLIPVVSVKFVSASILVITPLL
jgi:hypothetical protein